MANRSYFVKIEKTFLILIEFIQIAVHKFKNKCHFLYFKIRSTLFCVIKNIDKLDDMWMIE